MIIIIILIIGALRTRRVPLLLPAAGSFSDRDTTARKIDAHSKLARILNVSTASFRRLFSITPEPGGKDAARGLSAECRWEADGKFVVFFVCTYC